MSFIRVSFSQGCDEGHAFVRSVVGTFDEVLLLVVELAECAVQDNVQTTLDRRQMPLDVMRHSQDILVLELVFLLELGVGLLVAGLLNPKLLADRTGHVDDQIQRHGEDKEEPERTNTCLSYNPWAGEVLQGIVTDDTERFENDDPPEQQRSASVACA